VAEAIKRETNMFLFVSRVFRSSVAGSVIKDVMCEKCGTAYQYQLVRRGDGSSSAPYYLGQRSARSRAESNAKNLLQKRLRKGIDPVPCVDCGWIQSPMVAELRSRRLRWMMWCGWSVAGLGALTCGISMLVSTHGLADPLRADDQKFLIGASLVTAVAAGALLGLRWIIQRGIDPNSAYPQHPMPVPGVPRGFKPGESAVELVENLPDSNDAPGGLTYERTPPPVSRGDWVTVQLLHIRYPMTCCSCLQPTEEVYRYSLSSRTEKIPVRICNRCRKSATVKVLGISIGSAVAGAALLGCAMWYGKDNANESDHISGLIGGIVIGALFLGLPGYFFIASRFAPVRFSQFSAIYNTIRIRFRNRQYTTPFADANPVT
jgi:hypothetical protein